MTCGRWAPTFIGIAWGHACLVATAWIASSAGVWAGDPAALASLRALEWTFMLPLSASVAAVHRTTSPLAMFVSDGMPVHALPLPALAGCVLALACAALWRQRTHALARVCLLAMALALCHSGVSSAHAITTERAAERLFLRMVAADTAPWEEPASRSAARTLVLRHPGSRWASEAWRVVATDAELRGDLSEALAAWESFGACFGDTAMPGRALASLNVAQILERRTPADLAAAHYLRALQTLGRGNGSAQPWIAAASARGLERISRRAGLYATADYWAARARANERQR